MYQIDVTLRKKHECDATLVSRFNRRFSIFSISIIFSFYQIRSHVKASPRLSTKVEVSLPSVDQSKLLVLVHLRYIPVETPHVFPDSSSSNSDIVAFPTCIINGSAVTKTFQILYRNEEVRLESVANFKVHVVAETGKVRTKKPSIRCSM